MFAEDNRVIFQRFGSLMETMVPPELSMMQALKEGRKVPSPKADLIVLAPKFASSLHASFERRFCITKNGYVGLVPLLSRPGDLICIIFGGDTPYLVRPTACTDEGVVVEELKCQLVGECYIHGMMDGEMISRAESRVRFFVE